MNQATGDNPSGAHSQGFSPGLCRIAAGLDAGFFGALWLLLWFVAGSVLGGGLWFSRLNLAAAPFFGDMVFYSGPGWHTISGAALLLLLYSFLGVLYAFLPASRDGWLNILTALGYAGLVHLCAGAWLWKSIHPFAPPYFAPLAIAPAHLLFGLALWRYPARLRNLALSLGSPIAVAALAPPPVLASEPAALPVATVADDGSFALDQTSDEANPSCDGIERSSLSTASPPTPPSESSTHDGSPPPSSLE